SDVSNGRPVVEHAATPASRPASIIVRATRTMMLRRISGLGQELIKTLPSHRPLILCSWRRGLGQALEPAWQGYLLTQLPDEWRTCFQSLRNLERQVAGEQELPLSRALRCGGHQPLEKHR